MSFHSIASEIVNSLLQRAKDSSHALTVKKGCASGLTVFSTSAGPNDNGRQGGRLAALTNDEGH